MICGQNTQKRLENIQRQIEDGTCQLTDFVRDLVGDYEQETTVETTNFEENLEDVSIKESELFFHYLGMKNRKELLKE